LGRRDCVSPGLSDRQTGIVATKPLANQRDLALAYSPGVAAACELIVKGASEAASMTARANLVGVVTNGTAVLGLGAIGPLASKDSLILLLLGRHLVALTLKTLAHLRVLKSGRSFGNA